ncbi:MAG: transcription termination/antitermination NusG family protein [Candidatus Hydrothermales bacterium]
MKEIKEKEETQWIVFWTLSGKENKIKKILENFIEEKNLKDKIKQVLIPTETKIKIMKDGKRVPHQKPLFAGYVLVEIKKDATEVITMLQEYTGLRPLLARDPTKEIPILKKEEVDRLLETIREEQERRKAESPFLPGDKVRILVGPFENFIGVVDKVYPDRGKLNVVVTIFGRATMVSDLDFDMVERIR